MASQLPLTKSPQKTLGKGGSQMSIPRLTGKGGMMVATFINDMKNIIVSGRGWSEVNIKTYVLYGLLMYHRLAGSNETEIDFFGVIINIEEFERKYGMESFVNSPREFIIYMWRKASWFPPNFYRRVDQSFDRSVEFLQEEGYISYDPDPFTGYFTVYMPSDYDKTTHWLPVYTNSMFQNETQEDLENGHVLDRISPHFQITNWHEMINLFSLGMENDIDEFRNVHDVESEEYIIYKDMVQDDINIIENLENIIGRMIDTKYINFSKSGFFVAKIEIESERL